MYRVTTEIDFSYGHRLLDYNGKCAHPHGHNGRVQIELESEALDRAGMAVDFTVVKHAVQTWVDEHIDHKMILRQDDPLLRPLHELGEPVYVMKQNPTAESLAQLIYEVAREQGLPVASVRFWESPTSYATFVPARSASVSEEPQTQEAPQRVMVIAAHPDDAEFGCGATIAKWIRQGATAFYLICTNGDKGSDEPGITSEELAVLREREQRAAAATIGVSEVTFLPRRDGELLYTIEFRGDVVRWIRTWKPDAVFTHDPTIIISSNGFINHADHRATGEVTLDAIYPFIRSPLQYPEQIAEGLEPHAVHDIYLWGANQPNFWVDVSDTIQCKLDALKCHASQFSDSERTNQFAAERLKRAGEEHGVEYAETFRHISLRR